MFDERANPSKQSKQPRTESQTGTSFYGRGVLHNSFQAIKKFKQKQDQLDTLKKKLKVLKAKQRRNWSLVVAHKRKEQFYNKMQEQKQQQKVRKERYMRFMQEQIQLTKSRNDLQKTSRRENMKELKQQMTMMKKQQCTNMKKISQDIDKHIYYSRNQQLSKKREMRNSVSEFQNLHRKHMRQVEVAKNKSFLKDKQHQVKLFEKKAQLTSSLLQHLQWQQQIMNQKNIQSKQQVFFSASRINEIINPEKSVKGDLASKIIKKDNKKQINDDQAEEALQYI